MGRYLKNKELTSASYSIRLPVGTSILGPNAPVDGLIRYNKRIDEVEVFSNGFWRLLLSTAGATRTVEKDTFYGTGGKRFFGPMKYSYDAGDELLILVFVGNVFQNPGVAYYVDGVFIEFTSPPPNEHAIVIIHGLVK